MSRLLFRLKLCCHHRQLLGPVLMSVWLLMAVVSASAWGQVAVYRPPCYTTAGDRTNVSGLHCHLTPCWCPYSRLPPGTSSGSGVLLQLGPCPWSVLSPKTKWKPNHHPCPHWPERAKRRLWPWYQWLQMHSYIDGFCDTATLTQTLSPKKCNSIVRKISKRTLKNVW